MPETSSKKRAAAGRGGGEPAVRRAGTLSGDVAILVGEAPGSGRGKAAAPVEVARVLDGGSGAKAIELELASGAGSRCRASSGRRSAASSRRLVREELASLDADTRESVLELLAGSTSIGDEPSFELSTSLFAIREVLRERLPRGAVRRGAAGRPRGRTDPRRSTTARSGSTAGCTTRTASARSFAVSPEGARVVLSEDAFRYERPDVVEFYSGLGLDRTARTTASPRTSPWPPRACSPSGWIAELQTSDGLQIEIQCPAVVRDPQSARSAILGELGARGTHRRPAGRRPTAGRP